MSCIETMESRILFTAAIGVIAADFGALESSGIAAKADLAAAVSQVKGDTLSVKAAVAASSPTADQKKALATLQKDAVAASAKYKALVSKILHAGEAKGAVLLGQLKSFRAHPTSAVILAKANLSVAKLAAIFSTTVLTSVESSASATVAKVDADLTALATADPAAAGAAGSFSTHLAGDLTTLDTQGKAIEAAIAQLATDLA